MGGALKIKKYNYKVQTLRREEGAGRRYGRCTKNKEEQLHTLRREEGAGRRDGRCTKNKELQLQTLRREEGAGRRDGMCTKNKEVQLQSTNPEERGGSGEEGWEVHSPPDLPPDLADHTPVLIQLRLSLKCPAAGSVPGD